MKRRTFVRALISIPLAGLLFGFKAEPVKAVAGQTEPIGPYFPEVWSEKFLREAYENTHWGTSVTELIQQDQFALNNLIEDAVRNMAHNLDREMLKDALSSSPL